MNKNNRAVTDILAQGGFLIEVIHNDIPIRTTKEGADYFNGLGEKNTTLKVAPQALFKLNEVVVSLE
jgi:hypothetical protein